MPDNVVFDIHNYLELFKAESLLPAAFILAQVQEVRDKLSRDSDGTLVDYDDMLIRIQKEVTEVPALRLDLDISSGSEGAYQRQLLFALEQITDDCDRVTRKLGRLKSRMLNTKNLMTNRRAQFTAFYALAVPLAISTAGLGVKLSADNIKQLAASEFSRLVDGLDNLVPSLLSELEILEDELKLHKKTQQEKYQLGKDQVNAAWTSLQPTPKGIGLDDDHNKSLKNRIPIEEDDDEVPTYVSRNTKEVRVATNPSLESRKSAPESLGEEAYDLNGDLIRPSEQVSPDTDEESESETVENKESELLDEESEIEPIKNEGEIKGTFKKFGTPQPTIIVQDEEGEFDVISILNEPEPVITPPFTTPRKKFILLDDEDEID